MKHILVVTHPEATHHVEGRVGGWHDSSLTTRGLAQAERIAERLHDTISRDSQPEIYTSDLRRCLQTAEVIAARLQVPVQATRDLREISYGEAEGKPQVWLDERYVFPPPGENEQRLDHDFGITGAETRRDVAERLHQPAEVDPVEETGRVEEDRRPAGCVVAQGRLGRSRCKLQRGSARTTDAFCYVS